MNEYKKEDIKNIHFNHHNEIQFEYGGQIHHHSMDSLKEMFIGCWNLQQENKQLKEEKKELKKWLSSFNRMSEFAVWEIENKIKELEGE